MSDAAARKNTRTLSAEASSPTKPQGDRPRADRVQRVQRFESHALVDVKTSRWNPFAHTSAVLLDLSTRGFKVEFISPVKLQPGHRAIVVIPLTPFQILSPGRLKLAVVVKWFDPHSQRAGGVFEKMTPADAYVLEKVIEKLISQNKAQGGLSLPIKI